MLDMKFFLLAENVKLFIEVHSVLDQIYLLYNLLRLCNYNSMRLNKKKCVLMPFAYLENCEVQDLRETFLPHLQPPSQ